MLALYPGASGLAAYGEAMTVIGSNIANVGTTGYKTARVNFQDLLATGVQGTNQRIGKGVRISSVQGDFTQGSVQPTNRVTDLAIEGDGFLTLRDDYNKTSYTRAGALEFDTEGILITPNGKKVMAHPVNPTTGEANGPAGPAKLIGLRTPPMPTGDGSNNSGIHISANLNADVTPPITPFDPANVVGDMYNYQIPVTMIDQRGAEHVGSIAFRKLSEDQSLAKGAANVWEWYVVVPGDSVGQPSQLQVAVGGGTLKFDAIGRMTQITNGRFVDSAPPQQPGQPPPPPGIPVLEEAPLNQGSSVAQVALPFGVQGTQVIGIDFGSIFNPNDTNPGDGLGGVTSFASDFNVLQVEVDGFRAGVLEEIDIDIGGTIRGYFDNGSVRPVYRLAMTRFVNNNGLLIRGAGHNEFEFSPQAGDPIPGFPNEGQFGAVQSRNLERSNVDLPRQFVSMIETQRSFQANAKSITTSDEMLVEVVNLKR